MVKFTAQPVRIGRPVGEVFAYVADVNRHDEWSNAVLESRLEGFGPVTLGSRYRQRIKMLGRTVDGVYEVSDWQPDTRVEFRSISGPMAVTWDVVIESSDGGTLVTAHGQAEPGGVFKLAAPVVRAAMKRQADNDFQTLKAILEAQES